MAHVHPLKVDGWIPIDESVMIYRWLLLRVLMNCDVKTELCSEKEALQYSHL